MTIRRMGLLTQIMTRYERLPLFVRLVATLGFAGMIWFSSSQSFDGPPSPLWKSWLYNGIHVGIYFFLGCLIFTTLTSGLRHRAVWTAVLCAVYGAIDEWHQSFVPNRHASVMDWVSDTVGGMLAVAFCLYFHRREPRFGRAVLVLAVLGVASATAATF